MNGCPARPPIGPSPGPLSPSLPHGRASRRLRAARRSRELRFSPLEKLALPVGRWPSLQRHWTNVHYRPPAPALGSTPSFHLTGARRRCGMSHFASRPAVGSSTGGCPTTAAAGCPRATGRTKYATRALRWVRPGRCSASSSAGACTNSCSTARLRRLESGAGPHTHPGLGGSLGAFNLTERLERVSTPQAWRRQ